LTLRSLDRLGTAQAQDAALGWGWPSPGTWSRLTVARWGSRVRWARAVVSGSLCRWLPGHKVLASNLDFDRVLVLGEELLL